MFSREELINSLYSNEDRFLLLTENNNKLSKDDLLLLKEEIKNKINLLDMEIDFIMHSRFPDVFPKTELNFNELDELSYEDKNKKVKNNSEKIIYLRDLLEKYDIPYFIELGFDEYKAKRLSELKNKNIDITPLLKYKYYSTTQFAVLFGGYKSGVDINKFDNQNYDYLFMKKIRNYLENNKSATEDEINLIIMES